MIEKSERIFTIVTVGLCVLSCFYDRGILIAYSTLLSFDKTDYF